VIPCPHHGPIALHAEGGVERRDQWPTRFVLAQQHARPLRRFFLTRRALPGRAVAWPGCRAASDTSADRGACQGAASTPAWRCAGARSQWSASGTSPVLQRSCAPDRAHSSGGRPFPTPGLSAPRSRESARLAPEPIGSVNPLSLVHDRASVTAAPWYEARRNLERSSCASAPDGPSRPPGTGRGGVDHWSL